MHKYLGIVLLLLILQATHSQRFIEQWASYERSTGIYSSKILAEPQNSTSPIQYHVCGIAFRQSKLKVSLWNCNCGWRIDWNRRVIEYRCDWCDQEFWTATNAIRVKFCHQNDWNLQKTQTFETGNTQSRNWRQVNCPINQYATRFSARFGYQYGVDGGLVGGQLKCENLSFNQSTLVQDDLTNFPLTEMTQNRNGTLLQYLQFKYLPNNIIYGMKGFFREMMIVVNTSIEYGQIQLLGPASTFTIQRIQKSNYALSAINFDILYTNNYSVISMWTVNSPTTTNSSAPVMGIQLAPPALSDTKPGENQLFVKTTSQILQVIRVQNITYVPSGKIIPTSIPSCKKLIAVAQVVEQKATSVFSLIYKWFEPATKEVVTRKTTGTWIGMARNPINTDRWYDNITGCGAD